MHNFDFVVIEPLFWVFLSSPAGFRGASSTDGSGVEIHVSDKKMVPFLLFLGLFRGVHSKQNLPNVRGSCSGEFREPEGEIASMNFPANSYPALAN